MPTELRPPSLFARSAKHITPARVRRILERLGPTFIKVGQFLALRPDFVAQEYCDEFMRLTDRVEPFAYEEARRIIKEDLGGEPEEFFSWINPRPVGAGAMAQVHAARTRKGDEVAIKIQRPNLRNIVARDLSRVRLIGRILALTGVSTAIAPGEAIAELSRWMDDELDLARELRNIQRMHALCRGMDSVRIPRPFTALCGPRVVTTEFLSGVPFTEVLALVRTERQDRLEALKIDPVKIAENLERTVLEQVFVKEFFHADIHPGNLFALSGNVVGFVDFGLADSLDPHFRQAIIQYLGAVKAGDIDRMFDGLVEILVAEEGSDHAGLRTDFFEDAGRWQRDRRQGGTEDKSVTSRFLAAVLRIARANGFRVPAAILSLYRSVLAAETIAAQLGASGDITDTMGPLFARLQIEGVLTTLSPQNLQTVFLDCLGLLSEGPRQAGKLLSGIVDGQLVIRVRTTDSDEDRRLANARTQMISLSALVVGLAFLFGTTKNVTVFGDIPISWLLWSAIVIACGGILYLWRRLG